MDLARSDSNKSPLKKEKVNIDNTIREITQPFKEMAELQNKEIKLNLNYNKSLDLDMNKFHQLLVIVLDNSIKYTAEGDKITIETAEKDGKLILDIKDTGIGISDEGIKHVFERFYRDDKAHSRETGGSGLGLYLVSQILKSHGYYHSLKNKENSVVFTIEFKN